MGILDLNYNSSLDDDILLVNTTNRPPTLDDTSNFSTLLTSPSSVLDHLDNCTNDYCIPDEDYIALIEDYIFPTRTEWILIGMHCLVFVVGLVGNFLVCLAVYRNQNMRTVTNYFIVNLAVADFLVVLVCLPPTVLWDVTETWFFGSALCKTVLYVQSVSISVSVLTLTFISVDRWYAICFPLKFKSTTGRAKVAIFIIWFFSMSLVFPELLVLDTKARQRLRVVTRYFTDCTASWSDDTQKRYQIVLLVLLYVAPFILMSIAYHQIVRVLWNNDIPGNSESKVVINTNTSKSSSSTTKRSTVVGRPNASSDGQIRSRRKAAKMLIAVVAMFGVCYFPVHLLNLLRYSMELPQNDNTVTVSLISHWLCYANSAMNPVIYNFMSGKFRKEFRKAFLCCFCFCCRSGRSATGCHRNRSRHFRTTTTYHCKYTSTSTHIDTVNINLNSIT